MNTREIYFASAREFQDPFEGATSVVPPGAQIDTRIASGGEPPEHEFEALRRLTKISCWHRSNFESDAMWQLYAGAWKGVAICTSPGRIGSAAATFRLEPHHKGEDLWGGNVRYVDLVQERLKASMIGRFWYKHMAFSWEREYRLCISLRHAESFGVQVPEKGIKVAFDLDQLVESIYLGPSLDPSEVLMIRQSAERAGLADRIRVSSMLGTPRYT